MESPPQTRRPLVVVVGCALSLLPILVTLASFALVPGITLGLFTFLSVSCLLPICALIGAYFGRNGARILLAVLLVAGIALGVWVNSPWDLERVVMMAASVAGTVLLFVPAANTWYREQLLQLG